MWKFPKRERRIEVEEYCPEGYRLELNWCQKAYGFKPITYTALLEILLDKIIRLEISEDNYSVRYGQRTSNYSAEPLKLLKLISHYKDNMFVLNMNCSDRKHDLWVIDKFDSGGNWYYKEFREI